MRVSQKAVLNDIFEFRGRAREVVDVRFKEGMKGALRHILERTVTRSDFMAFLIKRAAFMEGYFLTPSDMAEVSVRLLDPIAKARASDELRRALQGWETLADEKLDRLADALNSPFFTEMALSKVGVLCLSGHPLNQPMWAHYADGGRGAVVGIKTASKRFFRPPDEHLARSSPLGRIRYSNEIADALFDDIYSIFLNKNMDWSYEKEWRAFYLLQECESVGVDAGGNPIYLLEFDPEDIVEIYYGYKFDLERVMDCALPLIMSNAPARSCFVTGFSVEGLVAEHWSNDARD